MNYTELWPSWATFINVLNVFYHAHSPYYTPLLSFLLSFIQEKEMWQSSWLILSDMLISLPFFFSANNMISFFFISEYTELCMCATLSLFIHPVMDTDTGTINVTITTTMVGMYTYTCVYVSVSHCIWFLWDIRLVVTEMNYLEILFLGFFFPEPPYWFPQWLN